MDLCLSILKEDYWVAKSSPHSTDLSWIDWEQEFVSVTKTLDEISVVIPEQPLPQPFVKEGPFKGFKIEGVLEFSLTGILVRLLTPLAQSKISVFTLSTFNTDYIFVPKAKFKDSIGIFNSINGVKVID